MYVCSVISEDVMRAREASERRQERKAREKEAEAERRRIEDEGCTWGFAEDARDDGSDGEAEANDGEAVAGDEVDEEVWLITSLSHPLHGRRHGVGVSCQ
jgi:hypothetical protein